MLTQLLTTVKRGRSPGLSEVLLSELLSAGLNAAGFSEHQKWALKSLVEQAIVGPLSALGGGMVTVRMSPVMRWWPWEVLGRKAGVEEDVVLVSALPAKNPLNIPLTHNQFYAHILSLSTDPSPTTTLQHSSYHTRNLTLTSHPALTRNPFGTIIVPWPQDETGQTPPGVMLTMEEAASIEWVVLRECVVKVLGNGWEGGVAVGSGMGAVGALEGGNIDKGASEADSEELYGRM